MQTSNTTCLPCGRSRQGQNYNKLCWRHWSGACKNSECPWVHEGHENYEKLKAEKDARSLCFFEAKGNTCTREDCPYSHREGRNSEHYKDALAAEKDKQAAKAAKAQQAAAKADQAAKALSEAEAAKAAKADQAAKALSEAEEAEAAKAAKAGKAASKKKAGQGAKALSEAEEAEAAKAGEAGKHPSKKKAAQAAEAKAVIMAVGDQMLVAVFEQSMDGIWFPTTPCIKSLDEFVDKSGLKPEKLHTEVLLLVKTSSKTEIRPFKPGSSEAFFDELRVGYLRDLRTLLDLQDIKISEDALRKSQRQVLFEVRSEFSTVKKAREELILLTSLPHAMRVTRKNSADPLSVLHEELAVLRWKESCPKPQISPALFQELVKAIYKAEEKKEEELSEEYFVALCEVEDSTTMKLYEKYEALLKLAADYDLDIDKKYGEKISDRQPDAVTDAAKEAAQGGGGQADTDAGAAKKADTPGVADGGKKSAQGGGGQADVDADGGIPEPTDEQAIDIDGLNNKIVNTSRFVKASSDQKKQFLAWKHKIDKLAPASRIIQLTWFAAFIQTDEEDWKAYKSEQEAEQEAEQEPEPEPEPEQ